MYMAQIPSFLYKAALLAASPQVSVPGPQLLPLPAALLDVGMTGQHGISQGFARSYSVSWRYLHPKHTLG